MLSITNITELERLLCALSEQLARYGLHYELIIVGGSALLAFGLSGPVRTQSNR